MSTDLEFAVRFTQYAGHDIVGLRATTRRRMKLDRTSVTDVDEAINARFIEAVRAREGTATSVRGEEQSSVVADAVRVWTIDPIDGTGEYINDSVLDQWRTTCIGISLFVNGRLVLAVVHNPFRNETFVTEESGPTRLNGRRIMCSSATLRPGMPYDYTYWNGTRFDVRRLELTFGRPRRVYSAIYQACEVAAGRSAFAVYPGDTIHDIAPGALIAARAGARVTDLRGQQLRWNDLSHGVLYAAPVVQQEVLQAIAAL